MEIWEQARAGWWRASPPAQARRPASTDFAARASRLVAWAPGFSLRALLRAATGDERLALCLHRVPIRRRQAEGLPAMALPARALDSLLDLLLSVRPAATDRWLTVSFDDGYDDAARYVLSRAPFYPAVEFLFFVCPEKAERRVGFRWDLDELRARQGLPAWDWGAGADPARENERPELQGLADLEEFRLADVETCRRIQRLPNAALGNHTNGHLLQSALTPAQAREEYRRSTRDFERLFGAQRHFAIPYGTPGLEFGEEHVRALQEVGDFQIWSTAGRSHPAQERRSGAAVLPRFAVDGTLGWRRTAFVVAARSLKARLRLAGRRAAGAAEAPAPSGLLQPAQRAT